MKKIWFFLILLNACRTTDNESPSRRPTEALQALSVGQGLQLHRYDMKEIKKKYAGESALDQTMQALSEEKWDLVLQLADKHLKENPGNTDAFLFLAIAFAAKAQLDRSQFYAELVLKSAPRHAMALNLLGVLQRQRAILMEDYRDAVAFFNLAHQASPESLAPVLNLGSINLEIGNFEAAYAEFTEAKKICSDCLAATLGAGAAAQAMGRFQEAEKDLKEVLKRNEEHPLANYLLAVQTFYVKGNSEESQKLLDIVLEADAADADMKSQARELLTRIEARLIKGDEAKAH